VAGWNCEAGETYDPVLDGETLEAGRRIVRIKRQVGDGRGW